MTKEVWYRADADYVPENYGGGTSEYLCVIVIDENDKKAADAEAIKLAQEWATSGQDFSDVGHVAMELVQVCEVDGEQECFPEVRTIYC